MSPAKVQGHVEADAVLLLQRQILGVDVLLQEAHVVAGVGLDVAVPLRVVIEGDPAEHSVTAPCHGESNRFAIDPEALRHCIDKYGDRNMHFDKN